MKLFISTSATRKKKDVTKYEWYTFKGKRSVKLFNHHKVYDLELESGESFGVRATKNYIGLIPEDELTLEFKLTPKEFESIVKRCTSFKGKRIDRKVVTSGTRGGLDGSKPSGAPDQSAKPPKQRPVKQPNFPEDAKLTKLIRDLDICVGIKRAQYILANRAFGNEIIYYYDVSDALGSYQRKKKLKPNDVGMFYKDLEKLVETKTRNKVDAEVGKVKYGDQMITVLSCLTVVD